MPTEIKVMRESADIDPTKLTALPTLDARSPAMKKVLSPSSEKKMREKAGKSPEVPAYSCSGRLKDQHAHRKFAAICLKLHTDACLRKA